MERFDRRLVPQSLDQRDLKKRRLAPNSSPLLQDLQARYVKLSRRLRQQDLFVLMRTLFPQDYYLQSRSVSRHQCRPDRAVEGE
jgi:hypothetical protein